MVTAVPEIMVEQLRPDHDFMIIACDGIWDCLTSQQAVDFVYETKARLLKRQDSPSKTGKMSVGSTGAQRKSITGTSPTKKQPSPALNK